MSINLSNLNISLQQFQSIASGKYNAGEVKLASETKLGRINNHVHLTGSNAKPLSHEEVLAIKNAFVKALSSNGVGDAEIAKIRRDLGLSAESGIDRALHERSLKPLTRQQVRDILDRNAVAINTHAGNNRNARIRTSAQIYGAGGMNAARADRRNTVNASLAGARGTEEHEGIALAEAVIAGDVDFHTPEESRDLLAQARAQLDQILLRSKGRPDANREAVVEFRIRESGLPIRIATGMTELAFARRLEETIFRLVAYKADDRSIDVRTAFGAIDGADARNAWLDGLQGAADGGFKARTVAIMLLTEAGIGDWETLSLVNCVSDANALALAKGLVSLDGVRNDMLRNHALLQTLAQRAGRRRGAAERARHHPRPVAAAVEQGSPRGPHRGEAGKPPA